MEKSTSKKLGKAASSKGKLTPRVVPTIKIVVIGPKEAGKSALCVQYVQGIFTKEYSPTVGVLPFAFGFLT